MAVEEISNAWIIIIALLILAVIIGFYAIFRLSVERGPITSIIYYAFKWLLSPVI
ncbi:MAG: hypothetical protein QXD43_06135 [Candidatus Aenigmatarchaeota archaeon]